MPPSQPQLTGLPLWVHGTPALALLVDTGPEMSKEFQSRGDALSAFRRESLEAARLYFVCEGLPAGGDPGPLLEAALRGGVDIVQLREKSPRGAEELVSLAGPFRRAATEHGGLFILNDLPDLVAACGADGVHVGQDDMPVPEARELAGPEALVGLSTHSPEQVEAACAEQGDARPDQLSVGPVWETPTKEGRPGTGLELIEYAAREATIPWFAIGGIDTGNVSSVVAAGARRIVVVRAIRDAEDPEAAARSLRESLEARVGAPS
jgi:thiamine-phosphate pyrophosphorylase